MKNYPLKLIFVILIGSFFSLPGIGTCENPSDSLKHLVTSERATYDNHLHQAEISPLTAIGQRSLESGVTFRYSPAESPTDLESTDQGKGLFILWKTDNQPAFARVWSIEELAFLNRNKISGEPLAFHPGDTLTVGKFLMTIYFGSSTARWMLFDPVNPKRMSFDGLRYFDYSQDWVLQADFKRYSSLEKIIMSTSIGLSKTYFRYAKLEFDKDGTLFQLDVFVPEASIKAPEYGFVPFTDVTNDQSTYAGGRYLDLQPVPEEGEVIINFNRAYNPYCAYSNYYNCPVPPVSNDLKTGVEAGEQNPDIISHH